MKAERLETLHPEYKTRPRVYYRNLYRYNRCFIAGSVAIENKGVPDCAQHAVVTLFKGNQAIGEAVTDIFGDFKFDNLEEDSGEYILEILNDGYEKKTVAVTLTKSTGTGVILLGR